MEANEREDDSLTSLPEDAASGNVDASNGEAIPESSACDEQSAETEDAVSESSRSGTCKEPGFKRPLLLIGPKRGKIGKIRTASDDPAIPSSEGPVSKEAVEPIANLQIDAEDKCHKSISEGLAEKDLSFDARNAPVPYLEPKWGGKPTGEYKLEVLKSGMIIDKIDLAEKSFYVVGRLPSCSLSLAHPTISRHHAVIQYRATGDEMSPVGFYLYDLESTHGTFWNGHRIKPRTYVRLHGGHMIRFGCSQRKYIMQAPLDDQEEESELSVTQLKEKRLEELREREMRQQEEEEAEERAKQEAENEGIDWGMGEDADEETDLTENPYASVADEELYLDDPKKTLRGWFEREGYDLQYQVEEKGIGQFLCWISLPKECFGGRAMKAEALVKGKKKESVVQCALEACRILDRHGLLRQANHESRKRKARNWEEEDYYDSDEDNFLDRTGTVEKKREQRMKLAGKIEEKIETYSSLTEKHSEVTDKISHLSNRLKEAQENNAKAESNEDSLDAFMSSLNASSLSKSDITKMKVELQSLRREEMNLVKLINLTKPANLPPLVSQVQAEDKMDDMQQKSKPMKKVSQLERRRKLFEANNKDDSERNSSSYSNNTMEEEEDDDDEGDDDEQKDENKDDVKTKGKEGFGLMYVHKSECKISTPCEDETESNDRMKTDDKPCTIRSVNQETRKQDVAGGKKRKKESKSEKSKNIKKQYDEDVHSADYSTWLPPQNQSGDGRTNLNDKYGY
ncbi:PREDICTED: kanadaptin [Wasmannia auropunctata]|uniref:kanadaptin n=1 Tax=Wasmannia auropunctata TaxID=64793 RepID=UPI0005F0B508|nr:PREDICTED: kanadaptin [Wasmannia auropunctata]